MGALLRFLLAGADSHAIRDEASIVLACAAIRARADEVGLSQTARERMISAVSELARNQLVHARGGELGIRAISREGVPGLEVIAADRGPGLADPTAAYRGPRQSGSLGVGLAAAHRQVDELDAHVRFGEGMAIRVRSFTRAVPRSEFAILAKVHPDENVIGDHALCMRDDAGCTLAVVDGLGHGVLAREAADRAIAEFMKYPMLPPTDILMRCHAALDHTRGAVMAIARVDNARTVTHAGVGNISARVIAADGTSQPFASTPGVLGTTAFPRRLASDTRKLHALELVVLCSDGLASRIDLTEEPSLVREPPLVIAHQLLTRFGRKTDDALVAVMR